jgi:hypothetical protein
VPTTLPTGGSVQGRIEPLGDQVRLEPLLRDDTHALILTDRGREQEDYQDGGRGFRG